MLQMCRALRKCVLGFRDVQTPPNQCSSGAVPVAFGCEALNISLVLSGGAAIPSGCGRIHKALQLFQGARLALSKASAADLPGGYGSSWSVASTRSL